MHRGQRQRSLLTSPIKEDHVFRMKILNSVDRWYAWATDGRAIVVDHSLHAGSGVSSGQAEKAPIPSRFVRNPL